MSPSNPVSRAGRGNQRIRIVVADDHVLDRAGLVLLLAAEDAFEVVAETGSVDETVERCRALRPDVLVLALKICGQDKEPAIPAIRAALPEQRILALSERSAERCLVLDPPWRHALHGMPTAAPPGGTDCLQLAAYQGAMATLRRTAEPLDLYLAVRLAAEGQASYDPRTAIRILAEGGATAVGMGHRFSARETQVAALLVEGHSNKEIASLLGIHEPTVKKHVRHILGKLGVQDRLQAGLYLARHPLELAP